MLFRPALFMILLFLCLACQPAPAQQTAPVPASIKPLSDPTALPAPTPTLTSIPTPTATASLVPTPSIFPTVRHIEPRTQVDVQLTNSPTPGVVHGSGMKETFYGRAAILNEEAKVLLSQGQYVEAISVLKEVQSLVDEPSQVLHNQIGHAYRALRELDQSIYHFSRALEVHDNSTDRVNRSLVYRYSNQCKEATWML